MSLQTHPAIPIYQHALAQKKAEGHYGESQTRFAFQEMLRCIATERGLTYTDEEGVGKGKRKKVDGVVKDQYSALGHWEAKDENDDLDAEIQKKIKAGYPLSNIIFENTKRAILWQNNRQVEEFDLLKAEQVGQLLDRFFDYTEADREGFDEAVRDFLGKVPELAGALFDKIEAERDKPKFKTAFDKFFAVCQNALNPNIKADQVEEMLVQHLLTERLFKGVFDDEIWFHDNVIAREIEDVIKALATGKWSPASFLKSLDPFFKKIEDRARTLPDYGDKQTFLDSVYERFFQAYAPETADTMGIVYTPQPIVDWMCASVERVLMQQWGKTLATPDVQILDPCTGTGNFLINLMGRINPLDLQDKYEGRKLPDGSRGAPELWANEIMLLPYYVASANIEHKYFEQTGGEYAEFKGLCFQDTLDLLQSEQMGLFAEENSERVARQKAAPLTVIIGNPPYNVGQQNENDNNKNRSYKGTKNELGVDDLIKQTYAKASNATLQNKLYDAYVRFFKWAEHRLGERDGIICFVTNNSFVDQHAFDGMRASLAGSFHQIWHLDLHGNVRKNPKLSGTAHNVFGIQVGVGITILVRNAASSERFIKYHRVPEFWRKTEKLEWLADAVAVDGVEWQTLAPNAKNAWLTEGLEEDFETFVPLGTKAAKASFSADSKTIFKTYSLGVSTNRDEWVYNYDATRLGSEMRHFIEFYNSEVERWAAHKKKKDNFDNFVNYDEKSIKWSSTLKNAAKSGKLATFSEEHLRTALYRPFSKRHLYYDELVIDRAGAFGRHIPKDKPNLVICVSGPSSLKPFHCLMTDEIPALDLIEKTQCFPLYTYSADGSERFDNISSHAVGVARAQWGADVSREDIFYATYALLHAPDYRAKFAENLKRELPRLPLDSLPLDVAGWKNLVAIGRQLGDLHVGYESAPIYPLQNITTTPKGVPYNARVGEKKMKWLDDGAALRVNSSIELRGFAPEMFDYRLGNRSALDWVIESYRVKTDARSELVSDPNRADDKRFIVDLIGRVATVSLKTSRLVGELPKLFGA